MTGEPRPPMPSVAGGLDAYHPGQRPRVLTSRAAGEGTRRTRSCVIINDMRGAGLRCGLGISSSERRQGKRFALRLCCRVLLPSMNAQVLWGFTRNMSRSGVLVVLEKVAAAGLRGTIGEVAEVSIDLPRSPNFSARCLVCSTRVVRIVDEESSGPSVACQITRFRVEDQDHRASDGDASFLGFLGSSYIQ